MAKVEQQTGMTGSALESTTTNALALRDVFDWEVEESVRAAQMMIDEFGVSSEEAYNLLAQGAQNGLDKNQNLLDSINEYSVHFSQMGFSAEEMFGMISSGAAEGVFDIDKLGDAVKEFGIRAKDGSDATMEAFKSLGLDAPISSHIVPQRATPIWFWSTLSSQFIKAVLTSVKASLAP